MARSKRNGGKGGRLKQSLWPLSVEAARQFSAAVVVVGARRLALHSCHRIICDGSDHRVRREGSILHNLMAKVSMK